MKTPHLMRSVLHALFLMPLLACNQQHDPTGDWKKFSHERHAANNEQQVLTAEYKIPSAKGGADANLSPVDKAYNQFCVSCHGEKGDGNGPAGASLNPKPRNFVIWNYKDIPAKYGKDVDAYIAKVIREGGTAVEKSPLMAAWGPVINDDKMIAELAKKVKSFKK